jgi:hypothetical protein
MGLFKIQLSLKTFNPVEKSTKNYIKNTVYISNNKSSVLFYPLSEFTESICSCGKKAIFMNEDFSMLCENCLSVKLGETSIETKEEYKTPNIRDFFEKQRIQWTILGKDNSYSISGRNIIADSRRIIDPEKLELMFNKLMTNILQGQTENVDAEYKKEIKEMRIFF